MIRRKRGKAEAVKEKVDQVDTLPRTDLVLSYTDHFVAFNYRNLEPRQLEPKATEQAGPTPSENQHACSRLLPTSPWLIDRGTGHLHAHPPCTLWECASCLGLLTFFVVALVALYPTTYKATSFTFCSWLKGDRPDNGDIEPSSDQPKKKLALLLCFPWSLPSPLWRKSELVPVLSVSYTQRK